MTCGLPFTFFLLCRGVCVYVRERERQKISVPIYSESPEYIIMIQKKTLFFPKVFGVESFQFWKSLNCLKVKQSPFFNQTTAITEANSTRLLLPHKRDTITNLCYFPHIVRVHLSFHKSNK